MSFVSSKESRGLLEYSGVLSVSEKVLLRLQFLP